MSHLKDLGHAQGAEYNSLIITIQDDGGYHD
jgi:hypothetical protein